MERITENNLKALLARINVKAGHGEAPKYSTIGAYALDWAYGGVQLVQYCNTSGGQRNITGRGTKRECWNNMHAFLNGMEAGQ